MATCEEIVGVDRDETVKDESKKGKKYRKMSRCSNSYLSSDL